MRKVIVEEETMTPTGLYLNAGVVSFVENAVYPLILAHDVHAYRNQSFLGSVTDIRREGTIITGEFTFREDSQEYDNDELYRISFYGIRDETRDENGVKHVTIADLRAVTIAPKS